MRVAITGGSNGIGRATAIAFGKNGDEVCITYRSDRESAREVAEEIGAKVVRLDVTDNASIEAFKAVLAEWKPDVIVNNAGVARWKEFRDHSTEDIEIILRTNSEGAMKIAKVGVDLKIPKVINIVSGTSKHPYENLPVYCASKAAMRMFTMAVGEPMVCVNPGMTKTRMTDYEGAEPEEVAAAIMDVAYNRRGEFGGEVDL